MRHLFVVALGSVLLLSGCAVYPLHGYHVDRSAYVDSDHRHDRDRDRDGYGRYDGRGWH